jgi:N-methylhydantoinase A
MEPIDGIDVDDLQERISSTKALVEKIVSEAVCRDRVDVSVSAELRYTGQGQAISLPMKDRDLSRKDLDALSATFRDRYFSAVGFTLDDISIELSSLSISARERKSASPTPDCDVRQDAATCNVRRIYDLDGEEAIPYRVFERDALDGSELKGPLIVSEPQTTTVVRPGWSVHRTHQGHLVLQRVSQ